MNSPTKCIMDVSIHSGRASGSAIEALEPRRLLSTFGQSDSFSVSQPDGTVVSAGTVYLYHSVYDEDVYGLELSRSNADGSLDTTFSDDGRLTDRRLNAEDYSLRLTDLEVATDGAIAVSGSAGQYMVVALYARDGTRLSYATSDIGKDWPYHFAVGGPEMAFRPDGTLLVAGVNDVNGDPAFVVSTFRGPAHFPGTGWVTADFAAELGIPATDEVVRDVFAHPDNSFTVVGLTQSHTADSDGDSPVYLAFARFKPDGQLDPSVGGNGLVTYRVGAVPRAEFDAFARAHNFSVADDGKYIVEAEDTQTPEIVTTRFNADGTLDASFGDRGVRRTSEQLPYSTRVNQPNTGLIQAEAFDFGGEGISYHDADPANRGNAYRSSGVDVGPTSDAGGGHAVGWTEPGEWLEYTIEVNNPATYNILTRVANPAPGARFHIELDGIDVTGPLAVPDTDSWHRSKTVASKPIHLSAGQHVLRLAFDQAASNGAVGNFNWLRLVHGLDVTFGEAGLVEGVDGLVLPQPDGKTSVIARDQLTRLSAEGNIELSVAVPAWRSDPTAAVLQPDGKILVAAAIDADGDVLFGLWRFNPDGTIDQSFGRNGFAPSPRDIERLALQPDGRILAGGHAVHPSRPFLLRYTPEGTLDANFAAAYDFDEREFIGADAAGRIYLVSFANGPCQVEENYHDLECPRLMFIRRLGPDGSSSPSYGDNGLTTVIRPESQSWARYPTFWSPQVLPNGAVISGEMHVAYIGTDETSVITVPPDGAAEMTVHPEQYSDFTGTGLLARFDGEFVVSGHFDPYFDDIGPYFSEDHYSLIGGGRRTPWAHLYETDAIDAMAFTEDGALLVSSAAGITKFYGVQPRQTPRRPAPWSVGQRIEAEDFDDGGADISYNDADTVNRGGAYRVSRVDVGPTNDTGGGYAVGWTTPGEWLEYTVNIPRDGLYDLDVRAANAAVGARFHVEIDGADVSGPLTVPDTGSFHRSQTLRHSGIHLTQGTHVLRLAFDQAASNGAVGNFNWLRLSNSIVRPARPPVRREIAPDREMTNRYHATAAAAAQTTSLFQKRRPIRPAPIW